MFDKPGAPSRSKPGDPTTERDGAEDERIALRCHRKELQLLDSFVASGEFRSRSELMRAALHEFLRARTRPVGVPAAADPQGLLEVPVRLRQEEVDVLQAYGSLTANGHPLADVLATIVRRGELEFKVAELVARSRAQVRDAAEARGRLENLQRSGEELERRGVVGR